MAHLITTSPTNANEAQKDVYAIGEVIKYNEHTVTITTAPYEMGDQMWQDGNTHGEYLPIQEIAVATPGNIRLEIQKRYPWLF